MGQQEGNANESVDPVVVPDVATAPHPSAHATPPGAAGPTGAGTLTDLLPEITALAKKVGGFKKLAEIAGQLDRGVAES